MNFLKKKLKPLTSGLTSAADYATNSHHKHNKNSNTGDKDLEDDLYDEYVVEAPPHPSELLALGVDPTEIDVNDPEKLKELYRKAKEEGEDKKTNSILLAKQRQKEEIEEKKKTREEWKFFDSLTSRIEQVVKDSQKTLEQLKETSAIEKLSEPEYELRLSADQVFKSSATVKQEKSANNWIDFNEEGSAEKGSTADKGETDNNTSNQELDEFGCVRRNTLTGTSAPLADAQNLIVEELFEDLGIDLRPAGKQNRAAQQQPVASQQVAVGSNPNIESRRQSSSSAKNIDLKATARPRPRPNTATESVTAAKAQEPDPFDTSFVATTEPVEAPLLGSNNEASIPVEQAPPSPRVFDPFDTSYINL